jgi:hypothetical protein
MRSLPSSTLICQSRSELVGNLRCKHVAKPAKAWISDVKYAMSWPGVPLPDPVWIHNGRASWNTAEIARMLRLHHGPQFAEIGEDVVDFFSVEIHPDGWIGLEGHRNGVKRVGTFPIGSEHWKLFYPVDSRAPIFR